MKNKNKIIKVFLLGMVFLLIGAIFYISYLLNNNSSNEKSTIVSKKIKAADVSYQREITLLPDQVSPTETESLISPTLTKIINTPIPTEVLLAYQNQELEITNTTTPTETLTTTVLITKKEERLPKAGFINNVLIIFISCTSLIFFGLLF
ncbi:MAG: hypothetical protein N2482_00320 [Patescibacteria group bacterium]|nr:hypothetical protein [Patescibacteria group bacterium]